MERIEGGRVRIVGQVLRTNSNRQRDYFGEQKAQIQTEYELSKYFSSSFWRDRIPFAPKTLFVDCVVSETPKPKRGRKEKDIMFNSPGYRINHRVTAITYTLKEEGHTTPVIAFGFDGGKRVRAMFFKEFGTLMIGNITNRTSDKRYLGAIIEYLKTENLLAPLPVVPVPAEPTESYIHMVELHKGEQVIVKLKADRKTVTVGCDPEFEYVKDGRVIDTPAMFSGTSETREIGVDGSYQRPIEIRPKPFEKPTDMISYMCGIMKRFPEGAHLSVCGDKFAIGAHIHIGVGHGYHTAPDLTWLFDHFLGKPTINFSGKARGSYKALSQVREQPWGFEYRSCPSAIFCSPEIARIAVKMVKHLTECYINGQTMEINEVPSFEDYWNYCGLIPKEYETWCEFLAQYPTFLANSATKYQTNVITAWTSEEALKRFPSKLADAEANGRGEAERMERAAAQAEAEAAATRAIRDARMARDRVNRQREEAQREEATHVAIDPLPESPFVHFSDDWCREARQEFVTAFRNLPEGAPAVRLFGLSSGRGEVIFGFEMEGYASLEESEGAGWYGYGIPYSIRMNTNLDIHRIRIMAERLASIRLGIIQARGEALETVQAVEDEEDLGVLCEPMPQEDR